MARAVKWTTAATVGGGVLQFVVLTAMARLIEPAQYGEYAFAVAVCALTILFVSGGLERALVVLPDQPEIRHLALPILLSVAVVSVLVFCIATALRIFGWLDVNLGVLVVAGASGVLSSLAVVPRALLRRKLSFGALAIVELAAQFIGAGLTAISLGMAGFGAYALAIGALVGSIVLTVGAWLAYPRSNTLGRGGRLPFRRLAAMATSLARSSVMETVSAQLPPLAIGPLLGSVALGLFNRAFAVTQLPMQSLTYSIGRVMVSSFVAMADDRQQLRRALQNFVILSTAITTPVLAGIAGSHQAFTRVVLGERWAAAASVVPPLTATTWALMTATLFATFSEATRQFDLKAKAALITAIATATALAATVSFGLFWVCVGLAVAGLAMLGSYLVGVSRAVGIPMLMMLGWLMPGLIAGCLALTYCTIVAFALPHAPYWALAAQIAGCAVLTSAYYLVFHRSLILLVVRGKGE
jgi:O-antigen/teichoic acid export membrane protein